MICRMCETSRKNTFAAATKKQQPVANSTRISTATGRYAHVQYNGNRITASSSSRGIIDKMKLMMLDSTAAAGNTDLSMYTFLSNSPFPTIDSTPYDSACEKKVHGSNALI